jgi:glycosyltransferase involved in cell wall biosynthesis
MNTPRALPAAHYFKQQTGANPLKLSIIIATRNRAHAIAGCLDSVAAALAHAAPLDAEIVVVDNGSTDDTQQIIKQWATSSPFPVRQVFEPKRGLSCAHNRALLQARGEVLAFTDDDCRVTTNYVTDLLRHYADDSEPVLRGGRIELGDPTDLPLTINTRPEAMRYNRRMNSLRHLPMCGIINGCNMVMPRSITKKLGPFDERFGGGSIIPAGGDTDYFFRAYLAYFTLEYVPDMAVAHFHGRKTPEVGRALLIEYLIGNGALLAKHAWKHPNLARQTYWDLKNAIKEILAGGISTTSLDYFSHRDKVTYSVQGAIQYFLKAAGRPEVAS